MVGDVVGDVVGVAVGVAVSVAVGDAVVVAVGGKDGEPVGGATVGDPAGVDDGDKIENSVSSNGTGVTSAHLQNRSVSVHAQFCDSVVVSSFAVRNLEYVH